MFIIYYLRFLKAGKCFEVIISFEYLAQNKIKYQLKAINSQEFRETPKSSDINKAGLLGVGHGGK